MNRARKASDDVVREIRRVFDTRAATPTDEQLSQRYGLAVSIIRKIGMRKTYRNVAQGQNSS